MKPISIFDVIGPNMIGPSSSHTAGAVKIALFARKLCGEKIKKVSFLLYGSFAATYRGHGTDKALVAGILGFNTDDKRIKDSFSYAKKENLSFIFHTDKGDNTIHPNTVKISMTGESGKETDVIGVSTGGGNAEIAAINDVEIQFTGEYPTLFIQHLDKPGVAAHITSCLGKENINIAFLKLYREEKGEKAYSIVEADEHIPASILEIIRENPNVTQALLI